MWRLFWHSRRRVWSRAAGWTRNCPWWLFTLSLSFQALRSFLIFSLHLWNESHQVLRLLGLFSPRPNWWADLPKSLDFSHIIIIIMGVVFSLPLKKDQDEEGPQFNGGKEQQAAHFEEYLDVVTRCCCLLWFGFIGVFTNKPLVWPKCDFDCTGSVWLIGDFIFIYQNVEKGKKKKDFLPFASLSRGSVSFLCAELSNQHELLNFSALLLTVFIYSLTYTGILYRMCGSPSYRQSGWEI